jgi:hypothetical protein
VSLIRAAGFVDVEILSRCAPFTGAAGQENADSFGTEGVNIRARKP